MASMPPVLLIPSNSTTRLFKPWWETCELPGSIPGQQNENWGWEQDGQAIYTFQSEKHHPGSHPGAQELRWIRR